MIDVAAWLFPRPNTRCAGCLRVPVALVSAAAGPMRASTTSAARHPGLPSPVGLRVQLQISSLTSYFLNRTPNRGTAAGHSEDWFIGPLSRPGELQTSARKHRTPFGQPTLRHPSGSLQASCTSQIIQTPMARPGHLLRQFLRSSTVRVVFPRRSRLNSSSNSANLDCLS